MTDIEVIGFYYGGKKEFYNCIARLPSGKEVEVEITVYYTSDNLIDYWEWDCDEELSEDEAKAINKCIDKKLEEIGE